MPMTSASFKIWSVRYWQLRSIDAENSDGESYTNGSGQRWASNRSVSTILVCLSDDQASTRMGTKLDRSGILAVDNGKYFVVPPRH